MFQRVITLEIEVLVRVRFFSVYSEGQEEGLAGKIMSRWVKNCSDHILSDPELSVLKKRLNFAVTPRQVPVVDMITIT